MREWTICLVARQVNNLFEWDMHVPLALAAGVAPEALQALHAGTVLPASLSDAERCAHDVCVALVSRHELSPAEFAHAQAVFGDSGLVEVVMLIGYFVAVS